MRLSEFSKEDQLSLRTIICPDASDPHIEYFLRCCAARQVDPFANLMYLQVRMSKGKPRPAVAMTIDGARMQASRTGQYAGSDEPEYDSEDGQHPNWCRATIYRMVGKERCAFTAKIRWNEFKPGPPNDFQWKEKPYHMLGKTAEMQALRRGFPESVSDMSDDDYEETASSPAEPEKKTDAEALAAPVNGRWLQAVKAFADLKMTEADMLQKVSKASPELVNDAEMETLRVWYDELAKAAPQAKGHTA